MKMDDILQVIIEETENVLSSNNGPEVNPKSPIEDDDIQTSLFPSSLSIHSREMLFPPAKSKTYKCKYCFEELPNMSVYSLHLKTHSRERPYGCMYCDKSFTTRNILKQHERIHTKERPYSCQECHKTFSHRTALSNHIRTHTGEKPYDCSFCEKSFGEKAKLLLHMRVHTGEKPFVCNHCQRAFRDKSSYNVHLRIHTGEKPFRCTYCQRSFTHRNSFKDHLRTHTGEKPYICGYCQRAFTKQSTLRKHLEVHGITKPCEIHAHAMVKMNTMTSEHNQVSIGKSQPEVQCTSFSGFTSTRISPLQNDPFLGQTEPPMPSSVRPAVLTVMRMKHRSRSVKLIHRNNRLACSLLRLHHRNQTVVCTLCRTLHEADDELIDHHHTPETETWKFSHDAVQLMTSMVGVETAVALGLHQFSFEDILLNFLRAGGQSPQLNELIPNPFNRMLSFFRIVLSLMVNKRLRDSIAFDTSDMKDVLYDMICIYNVCEEEI